MHVWLKRNLGNEILHTLLVNVPTFNGRANEIVGHIYCAHFLDAENANF